MVIMRRTSIFDIVKISTSLQKKIFNLLLGIIFVIMDKIISLRPSDAYMP